MRFTSVLASLLAVATALPTSSEQVQARDIDWEHTFESWPSQEQSLTPLYGWLNIKPENATHTKFTFGTLQAPNNDWVYVYTLFGEGLDTIVAKPVGRLLETYTVANTNKPFTITLDHPNLKV
ncbi:hypothetical protein CPLU01_08645 [Colletotrichum plurivorum]|uniref:Uncharacterized protein n=1 Tax=Colletotrichum plurivorum TaxID=2175906 RepID=A0A8H6NCA6_9PEZI|nr:hypothetical protein CPLU01_08645 [Colletotrichum plurivorum]